MSIIDTLYKSLPAAFRRDFCFLFLQPRLSDEWHWWASAVYETWNALDEDLSAEIQAINTLACAEVFGRMEGVEQALRVLWAFFREVEQTCSEDDLEALVWLTKQHYPDLLDEVGWPGLRGTLQFKLTVAVELVSVDSDGMEIESYGLIRSPDGAPDLFFHDATLVDVLLDVYGVCPAERRKAVRQTARWIGWMKEGLHPQVQERLNGKKQAYQ